MLIANHGDEIRKECLALEERQRRNPDAVERQEIEAPEAEGRSLVAEVHQGTEARHPGFIAGD